MVKDAILANPKFYKQDVWISKINACETTCCLAGWADYLFNGAEVHNHRAKQFIRNNEDGYYFTVDWNDVGSSALLLVNSYAYTDILFDSPAIWPNEFGDAYDNAKTNKERAEAAAAAIEHFIENDGTFVYG